MDRNNSNGSLIFLGCALAAAAFLLKGNSNGPTRIRHLNPARAKRGRHLRLVVSNGKQVPHLRLVT